MSMTEGNKAFRKLLTTGQAIFAELQRLMSMHKAYMRSFPELVGVVDEARFAENATRMEAELKAAKRYYVAEEFPPAFVLQSLYAAAVSLAGELERIEEERVAAVALASVIKQKRKAGADLPKETPEERRAKLVEDFNVAIEEQVYHARLAIQAVAPYLQGEVEMPLQAAAVEMVAAL